MKRSLPRGLRLPQRLRRRDDVAPVPRGADPVEGDPVQDDPAEGRRASRPRRRRTPDRRPARTGSGSLGAEDWSAERGTMQPVAARSFSGRSLLLLLVVVALVVPLAPTVHRYFAQQAEISALEQDIDRLKSEQQQLKDQESLWEQDSYVEQQARERLSYVRPGETPYLVVGGEDEETEANDSSAEAVTSGDPSWAGQLWQSLNEPAD
ncbi:septum formation initiator family protein [Rothia sp. AR01]|uniref:Septum formation initiator family protein n=1 Tax=Rothia santali TaxID=2949643 RepID=A0A9X2KJ24_9MICC|nr:septum formation initiator family protein [Rothia santali]MCP3426803.1 septum formation initiator family protein [Rothia santali]